MPTRSRSRSRSRSPSSRRWITRKGKLGGKGFLSKSSAEQHRLLTKCVKKYGYRSCLGSVMVLSRNRNIQAVHGAKINKLKKWLKEKYGSGSPTRGRKGSFGCGCGSPNKAIMGFRKRKSRKRRSGKKCGCGCGHSESECTASCGCMKVKKRRRSPSKAKMGMCGLKHGASVNMRFASRRKSRKPVKKAKMSMCGMTHTRIQKSR